MGLFSKRETFSRDDFDKAKNEADELNKIVLEGPDKYVSKQAFEEVLLEESKRKEKANERVEKIYNSQKKEAGELNAEHEKMKKSAEEAFASLMTLRVKKLGMDPDEASRIAKNELEAWISNAK